ncbi:MAG: hypothetical protein NZL95_01925 [Chitinophagales bacterium]|nr:hypothetical protein [Chitinophagales bacterium]MDW8427293.1 hypothetical protein [Chitinophagales bacterium]
MYLIPALFLLFTLACFSSCNNISDSLAFPHSPPQPSDSFASYWFNGQAEITTYRLNQARYGDIHPGTVTLIFVTEPFSLTKHVKPDQYSAANADHINVLKLNMSIRFITGIYPYALMLSVFQPIALQQFPLALKTTASVQEWCGQTFVQRNLKSGRYEEKSFSYFESEGDRTFLYDQAVLEDALWTLIRINPEALPVGRQRIIPGSLFHRLSHDRPEAQWATLRKEVRDQNKIDYYIEYEKIRRSLVITFDMNFPHRIHGWVETFPGSDGKLLASVAVADKSLRIDYWNYHGRDDRALRQQLNLPEDWQ